MARLNAPPSGATVRMYRHGHGDCFLLAFRQSNGDPYYVLIDCGRLPGSAIRNNSMDDVANDIADATGGRIDLVVITHEHQDHTSGFQSSSWRILENLHIERCWVPWTEDPRDRLARRLRRKYNDTLLGLIAAANELKGTRDAAEIRLAGQLESLLGFEMDRGASPFAATVKQSMKNVKDKAAANGGTRFLSPHRRPETLPGVDGVRVFVLGPPRRESYLKDMNPRGDEKFDDEEQHHLADGPDADYALLAGAAERFGFGASEGDWPPSRPFGDDFGIAMGDVAESEYGTFFRRHYRARADRWRRIDRDWLRGAGQIALKMSNYVNNTSLVLAFELPQTRKVLLFVGDAQRGNWISWHKKDWNLAGNETVTAEDLLNRTVLYKVGHHGSHNATMNDNGLAMMAQDGLEDEFVAMIPAHESWANNVKHWVHPLPAIHEALREKAGERVLTASHSLSTTSPGGVSQAEWDRFRADVTNRRLYFEYTVTDD